MVLSDKRLLWHPRHDNKFVVGGGSQITLYEWAPDYPEIRHVTSQRDLQFMKCFAWSPDPTFEDLFAIGLSTGRVDLLRLGASRYTHQSNVLSSAPSVPLPVRNSRSCNALAFCTADPNYLAVGLDKVRGDCSLVIWDVNTASSMLALAPAVPSLNEAKVTPRPKPFIPRADVGPRADNRVLQQHAPTEIVSSLAFLPQSTNLLLAGISHRWLRLFDLRSPVPSTTNIASKVQGIAVDTFDQHRVATFGDGVVTVWDARKLPHPVLTFAERDASADGARLQPNSVYTTIEFSSTRRGTIAALERDAQYVRFWDLKEAHAYALDGSSDGDKSKDPSRTTRRSWANLPWTAGNSGQQHQPQHSPKDQDVHSSLVLADTRRTKNFPRALASFALVPSPHTHPLTSNVMVVNREGDLELYAIHDTPKPTIWNARGDLTIVAGQSFRIVQGIHDTTPPAEPWETSQYNGTEQASRSRSKADAPPARGRGRQREGPSLPPPLFGRGDEDGFPALDASVGGSVLSGSTTRQNGYSPLRRHSYHGVERSASRDTGSDGDTHRQEEIQVDLYRRREEEHKVRNPSLSRRRGSASRARRSAAKGVGHVVEDDISMIMRRRSLMGYGLSKPQHNSYVTQDDHDPSQMLSELWGWIHHAHELFNNPTSRFHGYDFAFQGLIGIWEGFQPIPSQAADATPQVDPGHHDRHGSGSSRRSHSPGDEISGNFHAALLVLAARTGVDKATWKLAVSTAKLMQRQIALQMCGWSLKEEDLAGQIKRWEKEGKYSRAACWLVFTRQYSKAIELLMRSDDESHRMMSGTVAALVPHGGPKSNELRDHCERLIVRLQDPYFRAMLTHLAIGDWSDVLEEEVLPFRERLAIAFQFLDDKTLSSYLRRATEHACSRGDIDAIMVTGLTKPGIQILQSYVDRTGDIQTAAILGSCVSPSKFLDFRVERWIEAYRDLLDGFKLHHHRVGFDIERGQILHDAMQNGDIPPAEWIPRQILIRCNYCNKAVNSPGALARQKGRPTTCPNCNRALPRCSICLMTLGIVQDVSREAELLHSQYKDTIDDAIVICQTCRHGGHASHILDWFFGEVGMRSHGVCAVADCDCRCADEF